MSILFEQFAQECRMRGMLLYTESTFDVDNALKSWLEKDGPDQVRAGRPYYPKGQGSDHFGR